MEDREAVSSDSQLLECTVYRNPEPGAVLYHESGWSFTVEDTCWADFTGDRMEVRHIGEGSRVTLTLDSQQTPVHIEITHLCVRDSSAQQYLPIASPKSAEAFYHQICDICRINPAVLCCKCKTTPVRLCYNCCPKHHANNSKIPHVILPIYAMDQDSFDIIQKFEMLKQREEGLRRNLEEIDKFGEDLSVSVGELIGYFEHFKTSWLQ